MAYSTITVGKPATDRTSGHAGSQTFLNKQVTANASGILTTFEIWLVSGNATVCSMGTLRPDGSSKYTVRDYESIGAVTAGSKQTFTGKNCTVVTGDVIGVYQNCGNYEATRDGTETGVEYTPAASGDRIAAGGQTTYNNRNGEAISYEAFGETVPDAPTSVSATDNLTDKVTITWTAGTGETGGHRVYRDTVDISGVVAHGTTTFDDTTAVAGTTYAYTVKAINDAGLSAASSADNGIRLSTFVPRIMIF